VFWIAERVELPFRFEVGDVKLLNVGVFPIVLEQEVGNETDTQYVLSLTHWLLHTGACLGRGGERSLREPEEDEGSPGGGVPHRC